MYAKLMVYAASSMVCLSAALSEACVDPMSKYYAGAVLNNKEIVDFPRFEALGIRGVNYFRECGPTDPVPDFSCSYSYRCHSVGNAMVYLGYFALGYQSAQPCPRIAVYFDTVSVPTAEQKANAVAAELRWLIAQGIVTGITDVHILKIGSALTANPGQYWTLQDTVLAYNMWFGGEGINGVWSVDGVKGVRGGCGLGASYAIPSQPLGPVTAIAVRAKSGNFQPFRVINTGERTILQFPNTLDKVTFIGVYNLSGVKITSIKAVPGNRSLVWDRRGLSGQRVGPGHYIFLWNESPLSRGIW